MTYRARASGAAGVYIHTHTHTHVTRIACVFSLYARAGRVAGWPACYFHLDLACSGPSETPHLSELLSRGGLPCLPAPPTSLHVVGVPRLSPRDLILITILLFLSSKLQLRPDVSLRKRNRPPYLVYHSSATLSLCFFSLLFFLFLSCYFDFKAYKIRHSD